MPQSSWTDKDERQYEAVEKSELERGRSESRGEMTKSELVSAIRGAQ